MRHRALPIHELFKRAMAQSLMALDTISCWCVGRWWADGCLRHHNRMQTQTEKWRFEAYTTKRISPSPDALQTFASHQRILIRRKRWKRRRVMLGCFWFLFSSKEVRLIFFKQTGALGTRWQREWCLINWLDLPKHATILLQFLKSSTFIYSVFACFLHMFICFWFFLHVFALACATFHSCTKYSIHLNTRLLDTMQDSGLHVSCFYTAQNDYSGPLLPETWETTRIRRITVSHWVMLLSPEADVCSSLM